MAATITPASLVCDANGTPYSPQYGDIYHTRAGGADQARAVFLAGNGLPLRWAGRRSFTILETGFGLGTNFLATWAAWQADPQCCGRLNFVSIEKHPFTAPDLLEWHARDPETAALAGALAAAWPVLTPGVHRIELDAGRVILTLVLDDFATALARLRFAADAIYLDGFAPARNPDAWDTQVFKGIARLAVPGATFATYTVARAVSDGLSAAGFEVEKAPGFGGKRDKLVGYYAPRYRMRRREPPTAIAWPERRALVIGAGIAGIAVADRLAARGWQVCVLETRAGAARGASGTPAGAMHPLLARDDSQLARLTRAGLLCMQQHLAHLQTIAPAGWFSICGHLDCASDSAEEERLADSVAELGFPAAYVTAVDATAASDLAGTRVARGAYWFPGGAWLNAASWCAAVLAQRPQVELRHGAVVATLASEAGAWVARDAGGAELARAPVAVLAAGTDIASLTGALPLPIQRVRGQLSGIAAGACHAPRVVVSGDGYCLPPVDGLVWTGASYAPFDADPAIREAEHQSNLRHLAQLLPDNDFSVRAPDCAGHVGFRAVAPDRMPLVGAVPDMAAVMAQAPRLAGAHLPDLPRQSGLYVSGGMASRGLTWAALAGATLADLIEGDPPPLESDLLEAIDPGRFLLQRLRRGDA